MAVLGGAAVDAESERPPPGALERLIAGRTTFIIGHRLSTVVTAGRVLVLKDGRIVDEGRHSDPVAAESYYAYLVRQQARGLLPDPSPERRRQPRPSYHCDRRALVRGAE